MTFNNGADSFDGSFYGAFYGSSFIGGDFVGNFIGNGSGLTDVWQTGGNSGTTAGVNFVGTTDNQPLELHANGQRILVLQPDTTTNVSPNFIAGSSSNAIAPGVIGATIGGGGAVSYGGQSGLNQILGNYNTIGGGVGNTTGSTNFNTAEATIAGGALNTASGITAAIGGGARNLAYNNNATIAGGLQNRANYHSFVGSGYDNSADGTDGMIGGGDNNDIPTNTYNATIGGGYGNIAGGNYSIIGGGLNNTIQTNLYFAAIGGGYGNTIQIGSSQATIGGGYGNTIQINANESVIAGGLQNIIGSNAVASTIGGGFDNTIQTNAGYSTIAGGDNNTIQTNASDSVISGGYQNLIENNNGGSTIGGGFLNLIQSFTYYSAFTANTIAGGQNNIIQSNILWATIGGGLDNTNGGYYSTIPGGFGNVTGGDFSFAAGNQAQALYSGDFVWADSQNTNFAATASDQVSFRCQGGVVFTSGSSGTAQTVSWTPGSASWSFSSDRNLKDRFETLDAASVLDRVTRLPIVEWSYKGYSQRHIGAMAQDFHALFPLNNDDKSLNDADLHGVELAAIQGLNQKLNEKDAEIQELKQRLDKLETLMSHSTNKQNGGAK